MLPYPYLYKCHKGHWLVSRLPLRKCECGGCQGIVVRMSHYDLPEKAVVRKLLEHYLETRAKEL